MKPFLAIMKALSDESRVRALCALESGELCVCQLVELLKLAPSTVSRHLSILRQAGLVASRKDGRWMYYRLPGKAAPAGAARMIRETLNAAEADPALLRDRKNVRAIRNLDLEVLCQNQYHAK